MGKVLRVHKVSRKDSDCKDDVSVFTKHECLLWKDVNDLLSASNREVAEQLYVQHVMSPLLGPENVDAGVCLLWNICWICILFVLFSVFICWVGNEYKIGQVHASSSCWSISLYVIVLCSCKLPLGYCIVYLIGIYYFVLFVSCWMHS